MQNMVDRIGKEELDIPLLGIWYLEFPRKICARAMRNKLRTALSLKTPSIEVSKNLSRENFCLEKNSKKIEKPNSKSMGVIVSHWYRARKKKKNTANFQNSTFFCQYQKFFLIKRQGDHVRFL